MIKFLSIKWESFLLDSETIMITSFSYYNWMYSYRLVIHNYTLFPENFFIIIFFIIIKLRFLIAVNVIEFYFFIEFIGYAII